MVYYHDGNEAKKIEIPKLVIGKEPTFPSEYFSQGGGKPTLVLPTKDEKLEDIASVVKNKLFKGALKSPEATSYLLAFYKEKIKFLNQSEWKSFNIVIAEKDKEISPLDLVDVRYGSTAMSGEKSETVSENEQNLMFFYILVMYRLNTVTRQDYLQKLMDTAKKIMQSLGSNIPPTFQTHVTTYNNWNLDPQYTRAVACFDMFMEYAGDNLKQYQIYRFGSKPAQYRDCSALLAAQKISRALGFEYFGEMAVWTTCQGVARTFLKFAKPNEELGTSNSYFPYMKEMGLVQKSPYSTVANPEFYLFIQTAGALVGVNWSLNAQVGELSDTYAACYNGLIMAFGKRQVASTREFFSETEDPLVMKKSLGSKVIASDHPLLLCKTPRDYHRWIALNGLKMDQPLVEFYNSRVSKFSNIREGSMASFLSKSFP